MRLVPLAATIDIRGAPLAFPAGALLRRRRGGFGQITEQGPQVSIGGAFDEEVQAFQPFPRFSYWYLRRFATGLQNKGPSPIHHHRTKAQLGAGALFSASRRKRRSKNIPPGGSFEDWGDEGPGGTSRPACQARAPQFDFGIGIELASRKVIGFRTTLHLPQNRIRIAALILVFCCAGWAFSFPATKALEMLGRREAPNNGSVFFAALCVTLRFAAAAALLGLFLRRRLLALTRLEFQQGFGLGLMGGVGLVLQMDGMVYTLASTSASLTQAYCLWLPVWFALRHREFPPVGVFGACVLVLVGGAVLAGVDWGRLRLGRGEWETLAGSIFFAGQILWLERPQFRANHVGRFTFVMFVTVALTSLPIAWATARQPRDLLVAYTSPPAVALLALLIVVCTLISFFLANRWQPELHATQAGLLYATEPIFTAAVALFVPGIISHWSGIEYPNEQLTWNLLVGGSLILVANVWMQFWPGSVAPSSSERP